MEVRSDNTSGKLLFEWNPTDNVISIIRKDMFYRIELIRQGECSKYRVIEKRTKNCKNNK